MPEFQFPKGIRISKGAPAGATTSAEYRQHFLQSTPPLSYPAEALAQGIEGTVGVDFVVDNDGGMKDVQLRSGDPLLATHALEMVRQWNFRPLTVNGRPVDVHSEVDLIYALADGSVRLD